MYISGCATEVLLNIGGKMCFHIPGSVYKEHHANAASAALDSSENSYSSPLTNERVHCAIVTDL